uniref:BTB domain-containing protein n=1 Tax=Panagrolaimus sp. PS1159 TaxID=55785 RepID=A0AC35FWH1_9BILA
MLSSNNSDRQFYFYEMHKERFEIFKSQNLENDCFDITFEIEGKKLHANKYTIISVSETLKSMLSDRWTKKDENVKIETYSYENFYEFLCFIYSGNCNITKENVFQLIDMAEFYGVSSFKMFCEKFLSTLEFTINNIEEMYEFADKYSLTKFMKSIKKYICQNYDEIRCFSKDFKNSFIECLSTVDDTRGS